MPCLAHAFIESDAAERVCVDFGAEDHPPSQRMGSAGLLGCHQRSAQRRRPSALHCKLAHSNSSLGGALKSPGKNRPFALTFACHRERTIARRGA